MRAALNRAPHNRFADRRFRLLLSASFLVSMAMAVQRGVISNFALQVLNIGPTHYGLLAGIREVPGLLMAVLAALTVRIPEEYAFTAWAALTAIGIWLYGYTGSFVPLVIVTLVYSTGLHLWDISRDVLVIDSAPAEQRALRLGQVASAGAAAGMLGMGLVWLLGKTWPVQRFFIGAGVIGLAGAALSLLLRKLGRAAPERASFTWRWEYRPLYVVTVLTAAREMVTGTLATYLLVQIHGMSVSTMALLLVAQGLLSVIFKPLIGRLTDRLGEHKALALNFAAVVAVFLGYAFIRHTWTLAGLYVIDGVLIGFADIALAAYAARLVPSRELGATFSMCSSLAHAAAVPLPALGGMLWTLGPIAPFLLGVSVAASASWYVSQRGK